MPPPPVGFEPTIPASARPQTYALDRAATGSYCLYTGLITLGRLKYTDQSYGCLSLVRLGLIWMLRKPKQHKSTYADQIHAHPIKK
jgi:hypothetical protein